MRMLSYNLVSIMRNHRIAPYPQLSFLLPRLFLYLILLAGLSYSQAQAKTAIQEKNEIAPDAAPQILQVNPCQASAGNDITVVVEGRNFASGVYVSFSDPTVQVISTRRVTSTQLETKLAISKKSPPGSVTLYISNPASTVAQTTFAIAASPPPPASPSATITTPAPPAALPQAATPTPVAPGGNGQVAESGAPVVVKVSPSGAGRGGTATLKIAGKNFAPGAKVALSNPGIQVLETRVIKTTELTTVIQIAADASTGATSLFVVNPDDLEAEASFIVTDEAPTSAPAASGATGVKGPANTGSTSAKEPAKTVSSATNASAAGQRFEVYNLGNGIAILQDPGNLKGTLVLTQKDLKYEEGGKEIFSTSLKDIREVDQNVVFGLKTGTFHIILKTGKSYNFIAASLHPPDTQAIVDSLHKALP